MPRNRQSVSGADPGAAATLDRVMIAGAFHGGSRREQTEIELDELEELARTLGTTVVERAAVPLRDVHPGTFFGSGTVEALGARIEELGGAAAGPTSNASEGGSAPAACEAAWVRSRSRSTAA